jgi:hypothetical protein
MKWKAAMVSTMLILCILTATLAIPLDTPSRHHIAIDPEEIGVGYCIESDDSDLCYMVCLKGFPVQVIEYMD